MDIRESILQKIMSAGYTVSGARDAMSYAEDSPLVVTGRNDAGGRATLAFSPRQQRLGCAEPVDGAGNDPAGVACSFADRIQPASRRRLERVVARNAYRAGTACLRTVDHAPLNGHLPHLAHHGRDRLHEGLADAIGQRRV